MMKTLGMREAHVVSVSPDKPNIKYVVSQYTSHEEHFGTLVRDLVGPKDKLDRVIIFCRTINDCATLYLFFRKLHISI